MGRDNTNDRLIARISEGLPVVSRPYAEIAQDLDISEDEVIRRIQALKRHGILSRFGVVVKHRRLGYDANAMVVWNIPDKDLPLLATNMSRMSCVTLCYRRPRREGWPYNLFTMIHGTSRTETLANLEHMTEKLGLDEIERDILFSRTCYKQRGARYGRKQPALEGAAS